MQTIYEHLKLNCHSHAAVRTWAYGYLETLVDCYLKDAVGIMSFRRQHFQLQCAVEARLQDLNGAPVTTVRVQPATTAELTEQLAQIKSDVVERNDLRGGKPESD